MLEAISKMARSAPLGEQELERVVRYARVHLGMDAAWVSRCTRGSEVVEIVDGSTERFGLRVGGAVPTTPAGPRCWQSQVIAPLLHGDGRLYGWLGCVSEHSRPSLVARDEEFVRLAAALLTPTLDGRRQRWERRASIEARTRDVLQAGGPAIVYQPIEQLADQRIVAFEAFARFPVGDGPASPDQWFTEAAEVELAGDLEVACVGAALTALYWLDPAVRLAVNVSAATLQRRSLIRELRRHDPRRLIIEVTEHEPVDNYATLREVCRHLRDLGMTIAVDDAGAGYAGFQHLVEIRPDIIKLDRDLVHGIDADPARAAMATGLRTFADGINATVLAEGVENPAELAVLGRLGIDLVQGRHIGPPEALPRTVQVPHQADREVTRALTG